MRYGPHAISRVFPGSTAPTLGYAPLSQMMSTRTPTRSPAAVAWSPTERRTPRPCMPTRFAVRSSTNLTGRPSRRAAAATTMWSQTPPVALPPKPPPTAGTITRTSSTGRPSVRTIWARAADGTWVDTHTVSLPPSPGTASTAWPSNGATQTRGMRCSTETCTSAIGSIGRSSAVNTAATPSPASASARSIASMEADANGERTNTKCSWCGKARSPVKGVSPVNRLPNRAVTGTTRRPSGPRPPRRLLCASGEAVPSARLELAHTAPEADALSAELRGRGLQNTW
jgi:hypothetical protein